MLSYPALLEKYQTQGMTLAEAQKEIWKKHPGLRRKHEAHRRAQRAQRGATMTPEQGALELSRLVREREAKEASGGGAVSPQSGPAAASGGGDYFREVAKVARELGCRKTEAQRIVNREQPDLWRAMMRRANPHKDEEQLFGEK